MELIVERLPHGDYITKDRDENGRTIYFAYQNLGNGLQAKARFESKGKAKQALRLERKPQFGGEHG